LGKKGGVCSSKGQGKTEKNKERGMQDVHRKSWGGNTQLIRQNNRFKKLTGGMAQVGIVGHQEKKGTKIRGNDDQKVYVVERDPLERQHRFPIFETGKGGIGANASSKVKENSNQRKERLGKERVRRVSH